MVDENKLREAADLAHKAASGGQQAGKTAKSATTIGEKAKKAWEWGEHIHFAHFLWTTVIVPLPGILLWLLHVSENFLSLLVLTAPLTIAVALIVACTRDSPFDSGYSTYVIFPGIALLGSAMVSSWSGIGRAFDWHRVIPHGQYMFQFLPWMLVPLAALEEYYNLYQAPAFFTSLAAGTVLGILGSNKPAPKS